MTNRKWSSHLHVFSLSCLQHRDSERVYCGTNTRLL